MDKDLGVGLLYLIVLATARLGACLSISPLISSRAMPAFVRLGVFIAFSLPLIGGNFNPEKLSHLGGWMMIGYLIKEVIIGCVLGVPAAALWWGVQSAGDAIDDQRAYGGIRGSYTALVEPGSILGATFEFTFTSFFVSTGGLSLIIGLIYRSFQHWGLWDPFPLGSPDLWEVAVSAATILFHSVAILASIPMMSVVLIELSVLMASRIAPQFASDFLTLPLKLLVSVALAVAAFLHALEQGDLLHLFPNDLPNLAAPQPAAKPKDHP